MTALCARIRPPLAAGRNTRVTVEDIVRCGIGSRRIE